jgi:hypothetical protein
MSATTAIAAVRAAHGSQFISPEVFYPCTTMTAFAKNSNLIYKIALLQNVLFKTHKDIFLNNHCLVKIKIRLAF